MQQNMPVYTFSAPGRTELSGNHTDHQQGCVLAAAVNLETVARVTLNGTDEIRIASAGYAPFAVSLHELAVQPGETNVSAALVRGVAAAFAARGAKLAGFDASIHSTVLPGSGLSSSAAFEVLIGTILNELFFDRQLTPVQIAQIGQYAENVYMGKPSGLMDQTACAVGGAVFIDFADPAAPLVQPIAVDLQTFGYALCIIDSGADHADLTAEYAAIPAEMKAVAAHFGKQVLRQVDEAAFYAAIPALRKTAGDRAVLRAMHFFDENKRVRRQAEALRTGDFDTFLALVEQSGGSSWELLQNIAPAGSTTHQALTVALAVAKTALDGRGAVRVHGGGFAGTIQAFVPLDLLADFTRTTEAALGAGCCHVLTIRAEGGMRLT